MLELNRGNVNDIAIVRRTTTYQEGLPATDLCEVIYHNSPPETIGLETYHQLTTPKPQPEPQPQPQPTLKPKLHNASHHRHTGFRDLYQCPECQSGNYLIGHGERVVCHNRHVIQIFGNSMSVWDPETYQRLPHHRTTGLIRKFKPTSAPEEAETHHQWDYDLGLDTHQCPRHPHYAMQLRHGQVQTCPAGGHQLMVTGTALRVWGIKSQRSEAVGTSAQPPHNNIRTALWQRAVRLLRIATA